MTRRQRTDGPGVEMLRMMKLKTLIFAVVVTGWLVPVRASAQFVMKNRPSLRLGEFLRVDLRARVQTDFRAFSPDLTTDEGSFDLNRARLGIEGTFLEHFDFQVERELRETFGGLKPKHPWRDAYV